MDDLPALEDGKLRLILTYDIAEDVTKVEAVGELNQLEVRGIVAEAYSQVFDGEFEDIDEETQ